jgi:pantetheine-phosphate adenylyltransferase
MLIAITGKSGSAKSTALRILNKRFNTIDLDLFCKSLNLPTKPVEEIFKSKTSIVDYCSQFTKPIQDYLTNLPSDQLFLVEASALHVYPELKSLFHKTIKIESNRLTKNRTLNRRYDLLDKSHDLFDNTTDYTIQVNSNSITELTAKLEFQVLDIIHPNQFYIVYQDFLTAWNKIQHQKPYHNQWHTLTVINRLIHNNTDPYDPLFQVAIWHDYDPNPSKAATYANDPTVARLIELTDYTNINQGQLQEILPFLLADTGHWLGNYHEIVEVEKLCFKEYQHHDYYSTYRPTRIKILEWLKSILPVDYHQGINTSIDYLLQFQPKIGWFCGSFNPFHAGHADILHKAENIFDKVVVVKAVNPNKSNQLDTLTLPNEILYTNNIPELIQSVQYKPTLIRGIRNPSDLEDAALWHKRINDWVDDIQLVTLHSADNLKHISSSYIRHCNDLGLDTTRFLVD